MAKGDLGVLCQVPQCAPRRGSVVVSSASTSKPPGWVPTQTGIHTTGPEDAEKKDQDTRGLTWWAKGLPPTSFSSFRSLRKF